VRVVFLGNDPWSVPTLEALAAADDLEVALVITNPPRPAGRGSRLTPTAVAEAARRIGLEVLEVDGVRSGAGRDAIRRLRPDVIVVVAYGELLTREVLAVPRLGTVNLHLSLLPRWRGAAPVQRAILEGDRTTGVSVMLLDEGMDTGPVLSTLEEPIDPDDDGASLGRRLATRGAPLVVDQLRALDAGTASPRSQDDTAATHAAKITAADRTIDWRQPASAIARRVRALAPVPGATTTFRGAPLKILRAGSRGRGVEREWGVEREEAPARAGALRVDADGTPWVAASGGEVALLEVAPAGRARMPGADWARGARIGPGERCS
jgi:methionyl-tRNA formyltransferase